MTELKQLKIKNRKLKMILLCAFPCALLQCNTERSHSPAMMIQVKQVKTRPVYPYVTAFDQCVNEIMKKTHLPGAAIAIVEDSDVLLLKGYGVKTYGSTDSINIHSVFRIGSVSKGFATMLTGILVQEHLLGWDDLVIKYLPAFKLKNESSTQNLTIRHILSHTSGLPPHAFTDQIELGIPFSALSWEIRNVDVSAPVGKQFAYQNVMFSLIADIVHEATKKTYNTLLHEKIFEPLGMTDASASYQEILSAGNLARPHMRRDSVTFVPTGIKPAYYSVLPAAGINASIDDMSRYLMALLGKREEIIQRKTLSEIFKPEIETPRMHQYEFFHWPRLRKAWYGMGWRVLDYGGDTLLYHGGYVNGYRCEIALSPSDHIGIAILTNASGMLANDGVKVFFDLIHPVK
jgi:beta-lactamase class C